MARFDEVELQPAMLGEEIAASATGAAAGGKRAPLFKRLAAFLTDLSLFLALVLALSPLLPERADLATAWHDDWVPILSLAAFVVLVSYYYFVGTWLLWGKTVGGAIFDVKVVAEEGATMDVSRAGRRWGALYLSLLSGGLGSLLALLPSRRSLADRLSATWCILG